MPIKMFNFFLHYQFTTHCTPAERTRKSFFNYYYSAVQRYLENLNDSFSGRQHFSLFKGIRFCPLLALTFSMHFNSITLKGHPRGLTNTCRRPFDTGGKLEHITFFSNEELQEERRERKWLQKEISFHLVTEKKLSRGKSITFLVCVMI